jgi:hypothetical protein
MMETALKIFVAVAISAFITRINYGILEMSRREHDGGARIALDVHVTLSCPVVDFALESPTQVSRIAMAVEDSYNRVYLRDHGEFLSNVVWKGMTEENVTNQSSVAVFQATLVRNEERRSDRSRQIDNHTGLLTSIAA